MKNLFVMNDKLESKKVCKNCNSVHTKNYCSDCGQKVYTKRFTLKSFFFVLLETLDIEKGFFYTLKMLFIQPGKVINEYISGKTKPYFNPLKYIIIASGLYAFLVIYLNILDSSIEVSDELIYGDTLQKSDEALQLEQKWMALYKQFMNFVPLLMIPFASLISKWFYKSKKLFYGEHLIINCFLFAQSFIIIILLTPLVVIFPSIITYFSAFSFFGTLIYLSFAFYKTFHGSRFRAVLGAFLVYLIGFLFLILFFIIILLIAGIIIALMGYNISDLL